MTRRKSSISVFSIGPISLNIDPEDLKTPSKKKSKTMNNDAPPPVMAPDLNAGHVGGGGGWALPHMTRPGAK